MAGGTIPTADRVRYRLGEHLALAVVACLILAAVGGYLAASEFGHPDTTTEERLVGTWQTTDDFTHEATVRNGTAAFERGRVLENRSLYFSRVAPVLEGTYVYRHAGDVEPATVTTELRLVKRAVGETPDAAAEYWRVSEPLATRNATVAPGESVRTSFAVNTTAQFRETERIRRALGSTAGRVELFVLATVRAETTLAGRSVTENRSARLVVEPRDGSYAVSENTTGRQTVERTKTVPVPVETDPAPAYGGVLAALLGLAGAGGLVYADREGSLAVSPDTVAAIERRAERDEFDEWISVGTVPPPGDADRVVDIASLEDLVDVAIDANRRVVEDDDRYVVLDGDTRYVFDEPTTAASPTVTGVGDAAAATDSPGASAGTDRSNGAEASTAADRLDGGEAADDGPGEES